MTAALLDRLADKFTVGDGCWEWQPPNRVHGYGRIYTEGHTRLAHRVVYELMAGPIPAGLTLDHLCRNRGCVRPDHLEPVTSRANTLRGDTIPARNAAKTHCWRGHEFTPENTYQPPNRRLRRMCRSCRRMAQAERNSR